MAGVSAGVNGRLDDPLLWGTLPSRIFGDPKKIRWALGAADILYTNP
jgi:monolysocardiolipin acyltransferase